MKCHPLRLTLTTSASASTASSTIPPESQPGARLLSVHLVSGQTLATTAVLVLTNDTTGQTLLTATLTATTGWHRTPRQPLYTATDGIVNVATTAGNTDYFFVGGCSITAAVSVAGVSKTGELVIVTG